MMSLPQILRLGLRQFAAGMLSVLTLGILNRVMKVEFGLNLTLVSVVIGIHYFAAFVAIPFGHQSDHRPWRGYHRTAYILFGTALTALTTALAPFAAFLLARLGGSLPAAMVGAALFLLMGVGMYVAGTAYLSLITDLTVEEERGKVVATTWAMMMVGILAGVFLSIRVMENYSPQGLVVLFLVMAGLLVGLTILAIWRQERPRAAQPSKEALTLSQAVRVLTISQQTKFFFAFLFAGIFFQFVQQMALEPFGGDVFALSVKETTLFNAYQMVGVLLGMGLSGAWLARRIGKKSTTAIGSLLAGLGFGLLTLSSAGQHLLLVRPAIFATGLGTGIFTVGGLSLMMDLTVAEQVGLFMGAWTLSQALANGLGSVGGGMLHDLGLSLLGSEAGAYALVFGVEAIGSVAILGLLFKVDVGRFRAEVTELSWRAFGDAG
jgi:BCD family chlorophyll transporter-like MFS transporter